MLSKMNLYCFPGEDQFRVRASRVRAGAPQRKVATPIDRYVCGTQRWEGWIPRAGRRWAWWLRCQGEKTLGASSGPTYNPVRPWACRSGSPRFARGECRPASSVACAGPHACREDAAWMVGCIGAQSSGTAAARLRGAKDALLCAGMPLTGVDGRSRQRCAPSAR